MDRDKSTLLGTGGSGTRDFVGATIGSWSVLRLLGEGSFGSVYEAQHTGIAGRRAALKILHPHISANPELQQRFLQEADAASRAEHENIIQIFDGGITTDGYCYSVMELLKGRTLTQVMTEDPLDSQRALNVGIQCANGLQAAHERMVVHRDLKPDNIVILQRDTNREFVKILDFGVAKLRSDTLDAMPSTKVGMLIGTPAYMSPEQWMTLADIDGRSDIYSLGIILFECLAGVLPFNAESSYQWQQAHLHERLPDLTDVADVPKPVADLVDRLCAKDREGRPQSMREAAELMEAVRSGRALPRRRLLTSPARPTASRVEIASDPSSPSPPTAKEPAFGLDSSADLDDLRPAVNRTSSGWWIGGGLAAVAAVGGLIFALTRRAPSSLPAIADAATVAHVTPVTPEPPRKIEAPPLTVPDGLAVLGPGTLQLGWGANAGRVDGPSRAVEVGRFAIEKYEVSMASYRKFTEASGIKADLPWEGVDDFESIRDLPVNAVRQGEAARYCAWRYPEMGGRLPTEIEWEYAARDGRSDRRYPWPGGYFDNTRANAASRTRRVELRNVDGMPQGATERGLQHMIGNVAEWTCSAGQPYPGGAVTVPPGTAVVRGGAANLSNVEELTATARRFVVPSTRDPFIGFRCAVNLP